MNCVNPDIKVVDNFIAPDKHQLLHQYMLEDDDVRWKFNTWCTGPSYSDNEGSQFVYLFYGRQLQYNTRRMGFVSPILSRLGDPYIMLLRAKANLKVRSHTIEQSSFHVDYNFNCVTGIYYVNTNNGYTIFEDGSKVDSVANRMILFPSNLKHAGTTCTDEKYRIVINFNYHPNKRPS